MAKPRSTPESAEVAALKEIIRDLERRVHRHEAERTALIPVEDVHRFLDRLDVPRIGPGGARLLLVHRFDVLVRRAGER